MGHGIEGTGAVNPFEEPSPERYDLAFDDTVQVLHDLKGCHVTVSVSSDDLVYDTLAAFEGVLPEPEREGDFPDEDYWFPFKGDARTGLRLDRNLFRGANGDRRGLEITAAHVVIAVYPTRPNRVGDDAS